MSPDILYVFPWPSRPPLSTPACSIFQSGHTRYVQQLHRVKGVDPYVVHATWTYNGLVGGAWGEGAPGFRAVGGLD